MRVLPISLEETEILNVLRIITAIFSLVGELAVLISYFFYPKSDKTVSLRMIISLVVANLIFTLSNFIEITNIPDGLCEVQSFFRQFSIICIIAWTCAIAYLSYIHTYGARGDRNELFVRLSLYFYSSAFVFALSFLLAGFFDSKSYTYNGVYCTSEMDSYSNIILYILIILAAGLTTFSYVKIARYLNTRKIKTKNSMIFPMILYISWIPWILNYLYELSGGFSIYLLAFHMVSSHLQGFVTAMFYGRSQLKNLKDYSLRNSRGLSMLDSRNFSNKAIENQQALLMSP